MIKATNVPYVKEYDENGDVSNSIIGRYHQKASDRRQRRQMTRMINKLKSK